MIYDFCPTFDEMTSAQRIHKLEDFFLKGDLEMANTLKFRETFANIEQALTDSNGVEYVMAQR